jgi:hypothetical protein
VSVIGGCNGRALEKKKYFIKIYLTGYDEKNIGSMNLKVTINNGEFQNIMEIII